MVMKRNKLKKKKKQQPAASSAGAAAPPPPEKKKCSQCHYIFKIADLEPHMKNVHNSKLLAVETDAIGRKKVYVCGLCALIPKCFVNQDALDAHKINKH